MIPRNMARIGGLAVLMASVAAPAFAGSFYLQEQSVRGAGRAFSGEAADRGTGSMWWNLLQSRVEFNMEDDDEEDSTPED